MDPIKKNFKKMNLNIVPFSMAMHMLAAWHRYGSSDHVKDISPLKYPQS